MVRPQARCRAHARATVSRAPPVRAAVETTRREGSPRGEHRAVKSVRGRWFGLVTRLAKPVRAAAAWRWGSPIARAAVAVLGLVVLAAIGRSALARGSSKSADPVPDPIPLSALP